MALIRLFCLTILPVLSASDSVGYALGFGKLEVRILAHVPLTRDDHLKGHAQLAGINLAMQEDLHRLNSLPNVQVSYSVNDTQVRHIYTVPYCFLLV